MWSPIQLFLNSPPKYYLWVLWSFPPLSYWLWKAPSDKPRKKEKVSGVIVVREGMRYIDIQILLKGNAFTATVIKGVNRTSPKSLKSLVSLVMVASSWSDVLLFVRPWSQSWGSWSLGKPKKSFGRTSWWSVFSKESEEEKKAGALSLASFPRSWSWNWFIY